jgi:hypothetical protein
MNSNLSGASGGYKKEVKRLETETKKEKKEVR